MSMGCSLHLGSAHGLGGNEGEVDASCEQMIPAPSVRSSSRRNTGNTGNQYMVFRGQRRHWVS